jgi:fatty acid desaturase
MTESPDQDLPAAAVEWPTLLLIVGTYGAWLALTAAYAHLPFVIVAPLLVALLTLHGSLQHETIHGHPTRNDTLNRALTAVPLLLWLPYERYRANHLQHHHDERLTDPLDDPESFYWTPQEWQHLNPLTRAIFYAQQTLAGRIFLGSWWVIGQFWRIQIRGLIRNEKNLRRDWCVHLLLCVPVVLWVTQVCAMPFWLYVLALVIPGNGILLIRSFAEHRARPAVPQRIAIVEGSRILGPLFLFNSLHALHHAAPGIPWYRLNALYRRTREQLLADNGGLVYQSYFDVARRFLFRAHDWPVHPQGRVPSTQAG